MIQNPVNGWVGVLFLYDAKKNNGGVGGLLILQLKKSGASFFAMLRNKCGDELVFGPW